MKLKVDVHPVTPDRWADLEALFGDNGACGGCWCQFFKLSGPEYAAARGAKNKSALKRCVARGDEPGLIAYVAGEPAGWCAIEPKDRFARITRSRKLGDSAGEETPTTWAIPCFFVARAHRKRGLSVRLIESAVRHARARGATLVEGYPVAPSGALGDTFAYHGTESAFIQAGFATALTPSKTRRVMQRRIRRMPKARAKKDGAGDR